MRRWLWMIPALMISRASLYGEIVDRIVAQVNDDIITLSDLNRETADVRATLAAKYTGQQLEDEVKKAQRNVLDDLIRQKLILQKGIELGFSANVEVQVSAYLERVRKENNFKDLQELEQAAEKQGVTMATLRERVRNNIISQNVVNEFVGSRISLLSQEIEKFYKDHAPEYTIPQEVSLSEILIAAGGNEAEAETKANQILQRIKQGEAFATLVSQYSTGPTAAKGGGIGTYVAGKLNPEIADAVQNVKEGDVTPVMKTTGGYVIYRVDSRKAAAVRPLDEVRDEIRNRIWQQRFDPEYERFVAQLKEDAYIQIFGEIQ
jgi:peptidyl-prolyl cis-trans isomerase SurA